jgi:hypothetical protein
VILVGRFLAAFRIYERGDTVFLFFKGGPLTGDASLELPGNPADFAMRSWPTGDERA